MAGELWLKEEQWVRSASLLPNKLRGSVRELLKRHAVSGSMDCEKKLVILAIAAPSFDIPSETFIRNHVRTIAPGATVLLCEKGPGAEQFDCPVLSPISGWRPPRTLRERAINACQQRWLRYVDPGLFRDARCRVLAFLKTHRPRALLAEYGPTGVRLLEVCRRADVPLFVHFHGYDASILLRYRHQVRHYRRLFQHAAGIIVPSQFLADRLTEIGCPPSKLHVSPCGIDPYRFRPTLRIPKRLVAVGRLVEKKAPHLTIDAFARIARAYPEARLDIVGDGPLAPQCHEAVRKFGLDGRIRMHGVQPPEVVARLLQEASLFLQHSITASNGDAEGLPVAILEAMACCLPVVSTRHSGIPEAVEHGVTGLLVGEHDVEGMAACIGQLLDAPDRAAAMGEAGRERVVRRFTLDQTRDRLRAIMGFPA